MLTEMPLVEFHDRKHDFEVHLLNRRRRIWVAPILPASRTLSDPLSGVRISEEPVLCLDFSAHRDPLTNARACDGTPPNGWRQWRAKRVHCTPGLGRVESWGSVDAGCEGDDGGEIAGDG